MYDPTISLRPTVEMNWQTDDAAITCHACADNWASIPLPYIWGDGSAAPCADIIMRGKLVTRVTQAFKQASRARQ